MLFAFLHAMNFDAAYPTTFAAAPAAALFTISPADLIFPLIAVLITFPAAPATAALPTPPKPGIAATAVFRYLASAASAVKSWGSRSP